jgi:predicted phosphodiesterase
MPDTHGDKAHAPSLDVFWQFLKWWKPEQRIHLGDAFDFRWLRRSASDEEKAESVEADFEAGIDLLARYQPTHFLWGNHDMRLRDLLDSQSGAARQLASAWLDRIDVTLKGARQYPYNKRTGVMTLGRMKFIHGYAHGIGSVRKQAMLYGDVVMGHTHHIEQATVERHPLSTGYAAGCLCELDMDYNRANLGTLRQRHGFAYGVLYPSGEVDVWLARETDGLWVLPSEVRELTACS